MKIDKAEVIRRTDIGVFFREEVRELKKGSGVQATGLCPFHDDKARSFSVNLENGRWKCFACGEKGDLFSFWTKKHGYSFKEAISELARRAGLEEAKPVGAEKPRMVGRFDYRDEEGQLLYWKCRFEPGQDGQKKTFCFYHKDSEGKEAKGRGCEAVIYNLPKVRDAKAALFVEGEKCADLLGEWGLVAVSLDAGAQSSIPARLVEWLAGKRIAILPDNDKPGREYAVRIARALLSAVESLKVVELPGLPPKGDIVDWTAAGHGKEELITLIKATLEWMPEKQEEPQACTAPPDEEETAESELGSKGGGVPAGFCVDETGTFFLSGNKEGKTIPTRLASPVFPLALSRDGNGNGWKLLVGFADCDGQKHQELIEKAALAGDGAGAREQLLRAGLPEICTGAGVRARFNEFLMESTPEKRLRSVDRVGWHGDAFVLPNIIIGVTNDEEWAFDGNAGGEHFFKQRGTIEEWKANVAELCQGNSRLVFALSLAAAAPLLEVTGEAGGGFHFVGSSSTGKTTALLVAGSFWGGGGKLGFGHSWRATANGLEGICAAHNDGLLVLDELSQLDAREAAVVAYLIANGSGKARMGRAGGMRATSRWNLLFLSSGEVGLADHVRAAGGRNRGGQEVRMVNLAADAGAGFGLFEDCKGREPSEFAAVLSDAARRYYGNVVQTYLQFVQAHRNQIKEEFPLFKKDFLSRLCQAGNGEVMRAGGRFALVGYAGELAIEASLFPWPEGEAQQAAERLFQCWTETQGQGRADEREALSKVRLFLEEHGASRFQKIARTLEGIEPSENAEKIINRAGFRTQTAEGVEFWVLPEVFKTEICGGYNPQMVASYLASQGFLIRDGARHTQRKRLPELGQMRVYVILGRILEVGV